MGKKSRRIGKSKIEAAYSASTRLYPVLSDQIQRDIGHQIKKYQFTIVQRALSTLRDAVIDYSAFAGYESSPASLETRENIAFLERLYKRTLFRGYEEELSDLLLSNPQVIPERIPELRKSWQSYYAACEKLLNANLRLVLKIAYKYQRDEIDFMDLVQDGNMGLMRAVEMYDPHRSNKFSSYARWWIVNGILTHLKENVGVVRLPPEKSDHLITIKKVTSDLVNDDVEPTLELIAEKTNFEPDYIKNLIKISQRGVYLDATLPGSDNSDYHDYIFDNHGNSPEDTVEELALKQKVRKVIATLSSREEKILRMRFGIGESDHTLEEVGNDFDLTRERIRQLEAKALKRLRKPQYLRVLRELL